MHRSGTSMVARILSECGVYLGESDELLPPAKDNVAGHFEHQEFVQLNDDVLATLGGAWDVVPPRYAIWRRRRLEPLRARAASLVERMRPHAPWGWKDPRTSLTLPFWLDVVPDLRLVVCVRDVVEVERRDVLVPRHVVLGDQAQAVDGLDSLVITRHGLELERPRTLLVELEDVAEDAAPVPPHAGVREIPAACHADQPDRARLEQAQDVRDEIAVQHDDVLVDVGLVPPIARGAQEPVVRLGKARHVTLDEDVDLDVRGHQERVDRRAQAVELRLVADTAEERDPSFASPHGNARPAESGWGASTRNRSKPAVSDEASVCRDAAGRAR